MNYVDLIAAYVPQCEQEKADRALMLDAAERLGDRILTRDSELMHFTASSMIINRERTRVLMAYHNIYQSWAWTGGHADGDGDLEAVALREAREETGIEHLVPLSEKPVSLEILHVLKHIRRGKYVPTHLHLNVSFALLGDERDEIASKPDENASVGWIPISEISKRVSEPTMIPVYEKILAQMQKMEIRP